MAAFLRRFRDSGSAFGAVARNRGLRRLALAFAGSEVGAWGYSIALTVLAFRADGAAGVGLLTFVLMAAPAAASPFTSLLGDRYDRVTVLITADLVRVALMAAAAVIVFTDGPLAIVYAIAGLASIASTAFRPAQAALVPSLAASPQELTASNVVSSTIESVTAFAGPAVGGVVIAAAGPGVAIAVASGTFLWSAALIAGIRSHRGPEVAEASDAVEHEPVFQALRGGLRAVLRPGIRLLVANMGAQTLVAGALIVFLPVLALQSLDAGEEGLGSLYSAMGVGGVLGAVGAAALVGVRRLAPAFLVGTLLWGLPFLLLALGDSLAFAIRVLAVVGFANTVVDVASYTLLQRAVPDEVMARVFGLLEMVVYGTIALGGLLASAVIETVGVRAAFIAAGLLLPVVALASARGLLNIDAETRAPEAELNLLRGVPFLDRLPPVVLEQLAKELRPARIAAGERVFSQGDAGDRFYIIAGGQAHVIVDGQPARALAAGDSFGEIALLRDVPRTATVTAVDDLALYALERDDFLAAVTAHEPTRQAAGAVVQARLGTA